ncbi:hypothetical protein [Amycolatopsis sp. CA-128772]|uniref:hypothetical protein n=1 Tax=Amycolatopsis sp. CA-128772 TaxID=2073159 RepID=UPI000CD08A87|nr:hypothetical protein [Amycolatopsis sp. CA-128772]
MDTQSLTGQLPGRRTATTDAGTASRDRAWDRTWVRVLAVGAAGAVLDWGGNQLGWWWVTVLTGVAAALLLRGRALAAFTVAVPLLSWGAELFRLWTATDTTRIARVTIGLAGVSDDAAWLGYVFTLLYAVLLCAAGAWVAAAARQLVRAARRGPTGNPIEQEETPSDA